MSKICLFGGSFDPIHNAHIDIAKQAIEQLQLDELQFIPTQNNPWKDGAVASYHQRVEMIETAVSKYKNMKVNRIEENISEGKNYTIDTLRLLKSRYPSDEFYYLIGMDQANFFYQWKEAKEIDKLVQIVVFSRGGYEKDEKAHQGFRFLYLKNEPLTISSTTIRNGNIQYLDQSVLKYISKNGIYLDTMIKPRMKEKRYLHTLSVAKLSREIALSNHLDGQQAYIAGLMHDVAKEMPDAFAQKIMQKHYPQYVNKPKQIWHQWLSRYVCETEFFIEDEVILKAIEDHTTASVSISAIGKCLYVADKLDPLRGYDSKPSIQVCMQDINEGFRNELIHFYDFSKEKNRDIDEGFYEIHNHFVKKGEI